MFPNQILYEATDWKKDTDGIRKAEYNRSQGAEAWKTIVGQFPDRARYDAANLAAHNWDVAYVDGKLLIVCSWSGGHYWTTEGERIRLTDDEAKSFYPNGGYGLTISDGQ